MSNKSILQSNNNALSANNLDLQSLIDQVNALPDAGGVELPKLINKGTAADLLSGKELIDGDGNKVIGTIESFDGSYECSGENTGGGQNEFISITIDATKGLSCHYIDENFSPITFTGETATVMAYRGVVWLGEAMGGAGSWQATGDYVEFTTWALWVFRSNGGTFVCITNPFESQ